VPRESSADIFRDMLVKMRESIDKIETMEGLKMALKAFAAEPLTLKLIDNRIMKLMEKFTTIELVDLLNTKSILRQKNISVLNTCAARIISRVDEDKLDVSMIRRCLLSCGLLSYLESQFLKTALEKLTELVVANLQNAEWFAANAADLSVIVTSIGMMKLKETACLDALSQLLIANKSAMSISDLVLKFVLACAVIGYKPQGEFKQLVDLIAIEQFDLTQKNDQMKLLNFTWSMCSLGIDRKEMINAVLDEKVWKNILKGNLCGKAKFH
jgi:hypothetical protein